jgi:uncharacterized protein (TIGR02246 family)
MSADEKAIRKVVDDWMQATARGDVAAVLNMMADDVVFMVVGREPFGKKEFAAQSGALREVRIEGKAEPIEIKVFGDWAYLRNRITVKMTPKSGKEMNRSGYTLTVLTKKSDGAWVISRDANLLPPPG